MNTDRRFLIKAQNKTMKTIIISNSRPLRRALCTLLLGIAALWAMPTSARAQVLFVGDQGNNIVGEYDATSGAAINANFITPLDRPVGLALSGNNLFVADNGSTGGLQATVGEYNATTGAAINANFITGLNGYGLALSGNNLFVSVSFGFFGTTVGEYNAATGAAINANFITGLGAPTGLALSGNNLFVANYASGTVGEYNATTGAAINANFIMGLSEPAGLALSGNNLFVANQSDGGGTTVGEYNATTGAAINANFITGLNQPTGLLVASVPEPSAWSMIAIGGVALLGMMLRKKDRTA